MLDLLRALLCGRTPGPERGGPRGASGAAIRGREGGAHQDRRPGAVGGPWRPAAERVGTGAERRGRGQAARRCRRRGWSGVRRGRSRYAGEPPEYRGGGEGGCRRHRGAPVPGVPVPRSPSTPPPCPPGLQPRPHGLPTPSVMSRASWFPRTSCCCDSYTSFLVSPERLESMLRSVLPSRPAGLGRIAAGRCQTAVCLPSEWACLTIVPCKLAGVQMKI